MKDNFYRAFEEQNRGSRKSIKEKLKIYLPFILPLNEQYHDGLVIDIGCGRGEWLELMQDNNIFAKGVDQDKGMLKEGQSLGLNMEQGDGIEFLSKEAEESAIAITAFHVVEHISFDTLQNLVKEALRVLKPGGILILETPNPENIRVSSEFFYIDPTHKKPIPSQLLSFLPEYYGFKRTKVLRVNENKYLKVQKYASLHQVLEGVSQDYAVIAQKKAKTKIISLLNDVFDKEYGQSLQAILEKFERRMLRFEELVEAVVVKSDKSVDKAEESIWKSESIIQAFNTMIDRSDKSFAETESIIQEFNRKANELYGQVKQANRQASEAREHAKQAWINSDNVWQHYQHIVNSRSWKTTKPLRALMHILRSIKHKGKEKIKQLLIKIKYKIDAYPKIKLKIIKILNRFPAIRRKLKHLIVVEQIHQSIVEETVHIEGPKIFVPDEKTVFKALQNMVNKKRDI